MEINSHNTTKILQVLFALDGLGCKTRTENYCKYIIKRLIVLQELKLENSHASTPPLHIYNYWFAQINSITAYRYAPPLKIKQYLMLSIFLPRPPELTFLKTLRDVWVKAFLSL